MSYLAERVKHIDSSGIRKVFELAASLKNPINLSIGQPDFEVPSEVKADIIKAVEKGRMRYTVTQGIEPLRKNIIEKYKGKYDLSNIIITSGVSGAILLAYMALLNKGDEIMLFDPYFMLYEQIARVFDAEVTLVDTYPDFSASREKLEKACSPKTKIIMVNSPSNPSGVVYTEEEIKIIAAFAKDKNLLVISDEIYSEFSYDAPCVSISDYYENTLILNGFSKNLALTGERIGYAIGPKDIISEMIKLQQYTFVCAPSSVQYGIENHINYDFSKIREAYKTKRDIVYDALSDLCDFKKPGGAFYAFPILRNGRSSSEFVENAIKNRVLVIPGNVFSKHDSAFRISFAVGDNILKEGMDILRSLLKNG